MCWCRLAVAEAGVYRPPMVAAGCAAPAWVATGSMGAAWALVGAAAAEAAGDSTVSMTWMMALQARTSAYTTVALVAPSLDSSLIVSPLFCTCNRHTRHR